MELQHSNGPRFDSYPPKTSSILEAGTSWNQFPGPILRHHNLSSSWSNSSNVSYMFFLDHHMISTFHGKSHEYFIVYIHISCFPHDIPMDIPMCLDLHSFLNPGWFSGFRLPQFRIIWVKIPTTRSSKEGVPWNCYSETGIVIINHRLLGIFNFIQTTNPYQY